MLLNITELSNDPIHWQALDQISQKIISGQLKENEELPMVNQLARENHISKSSVKKAYDILQQMGLISLKGRDRYCIEVLTEEKRQTFAFRKDDQEDFQKGVIDSLFNEKRRLEEELKVAHRIQSDLLPKELPDTQDYSISALTFSSGAVGGDFYDYLPIDEARFGLVIADACGKGVPAALLISQIHAILKSEVDRKSELKETISNLNKYIRININARNFSTLFYGIYDKNECRIEYINAGHNYPIHINKKGVINFLRTTGPALGLVKDFNYKTNSVKIEKDDVILFYTDGVTDSVNNFGEEYGENRLIELLSANKEKKAKEIINIIYEDMALFNNGKPHEDDKTLMLYKR